MTFARIAYQKAKTPEGQSKVNSRLLKQESKKRKTIEALGIEFDFPGYQASAKVFPGSRSVLTCKHLTFYFQAAKGHSGKAEGTSAKKVKKSQEVKKNQEDAKTGPSKASKPATKSLSGKKKVPKKPKP